MLALAYIILGVAAGTVAGLIGIAGGIIIIPALVLFFHYPQKLAQGTTLALLLPPIGIGAAFLYYRAGQVNVKAAILIAAGFLVGGFIGASINGRVPADVLQKLFGVLTIVVGLRLLLFK